MTATVKVNRVFMVKGRLPLPTEDVLFACGWTGEILTRHERCCLSFMTHASCKEAPFSVIMRQWQSSACQIYRCCAGNKFVILSVLVMACVWATRAHGSLPIYQVFTWPGDTSDMAARTCQMVPCLDCIPVWCHNSADRLFYRCVVAWCLQHEGDCPRWRFLFRQR